MSTQVYEASYGRLARLTCLLDGDYDSRYQAAKQLRREFYEKSLMPHVRRKIERILDRSITYYNSPTDGSVCS